MRGSCKITVLGGLPVVVEFDVSPPEELDLEHALMEVLIDYIRGDITLTDEGL